VARPTQGTLRRQQVFAYGPVTLCGRPFQIVPLTRCLVTPLEGPTTPRWKPPRFGLFPFRSPLLRKSIFLSFPAGTEMFQFSAFATRDLWIQSRSVRASRDHHLFDGFPGLIAVFRALQSLLTPRHPPCALCSLTTRIECSRKPTCAGPSEAISSRFNYGPSTSWVLDMPWIIAGKRADPIQGSNVFLAACSRQPFGRSQKTAASRLSLGRTPPGSRLENAIRSAFFSRCQLPRPNCQRTKQADDVIPKDGGDGSRPVMDRGSFRPLQPVFQRHGDPTAETGLNP